MRTIIDVIQAVSGMIEAEFGAPPTTKDIREGFDRPCFYAEPYQMRRDKAGDMPHDTFGIRIFYFSPRTDRGYLDLLQKQTALQDMLDASIPVSEDFLLFPEDVNFEIQREDMALIADFTVENVQMPEDTDEAELMEDLSLDFRKDDE